MTSDSQFMTIPLVKVRCGTCGLITNERDLGASTLIDFYENQYSLAASAIRSEPVFYFEGKAVNRSEVIAGWFCDFIAALGLDVKGGRFLEVGCGEGKLLSEMMKKFPNSAFSGLEPNFAACEMAQHRGVEIFSCGYDGLPVGVKFDVIYSFAVLEHLPDPSHFMSFMVDHLNPRGVLILCQPCQDFPTHDVYFIDHLHHFHSSHVVEFARRSGYRSLRKQVGHPLIPSFSMHAFSFEDEKHSALEVQKVFQGLNISVDLDLWESRISRFKLEIEKRQGQKFCIWGVGEVFSLLSIYAGLSSSDVVAGFDNNFQRFSDVYSFPVFVPDDDNVKSFSGFAWFLTFKPSAQILDVLGRFDIEYVALVGE